MGGHSCRRCDVHAQRITGVKLPLATLLVAPTPRALAAAYRAPGAGGGAATVEAAAAVEDPWAPLVPIRLGSGAPLFLAHAVGGNVLNYQALAAAMPADLPIYGLQAQGLDGRKPPLPASGDGDALCRGMRRVHRAGPTTSPAARWAG